MPQKNGLALLGGDPAVTDVPKFIWPPITEKDIRAVAEMVRRRELSHYGREGKVAYLENKFADYLGMRYVLATSSGTAALHSAYFGLGLSPGDEVLAPTYTFLATVMPLFVANAVPVLVDADPTSGNLDPQDLERHITERTRAIVVTHLWGNPVDMPTIMDVARTHNLKVVEDCAHAHGTICRGRPVGTFGDVGIFSLEGRKLVAGGQGGILVTNNQEVFERAVLLGHFNIRALEDVHSTKYRRYAETGFGLNYRIHPVAAAIASAQLDRLEEHVAARRHNLDYLSEQLEPIPGIEPPVKAAADSRQAFYSYKPTYNSAAMEGLPIDIYVKAVRAEGVPLERYPMKPLHTQPIFQDEHPPLLTHGAMEHFANEARWAKRRPMNLPNSEAYAARLLALPAYTDPVRPVLDNFAAAFAKVAMHAEQLRDYAASIGGETSVAGAR